MHRISKLNTNIIGEFDTFPNKLYYITLTDKWFAIITRLITEKEKDIDYDAGVGTIYNSTIYKDASRPTSRLFNRVKRLYYTPGVLMDEALYKSLKSNNKNKEVIFSILLYYCGVDLGYPRGVITDLKQWKVNINDLLGVVEIDNHNLNLSLIDNRSVNNNRDRFGLGLDTALFELSCDNVNNINKLQVNINGIERRAAVIVSSSSLGYLLNNSILTCNNSSTKYRFYRKSYVPTDSTVLDIKNNYYFLDISKSKFNNYLFSIISEEEYSIISKERSFKRISEKSKLFDDKSNQKTNLDDLIIGHIYSLPIADMLEEDGTAITPIGFNAAIQAAYLGKISVKDKPEFLTNNNRNSISSNGEWENCFRFGNSLISLNKEISTNRFKLRSFASGGALKTSPNPNLEIHLFFNIGQLAKFNETDHNFYIINVDDLDTKEKFIDYIADVLIPDTINLVKSLKGDISLDYFNGSSEFNCVRSSITIHSPSIITLINSDIKPENPVTDLGELFNGDSGFDLEKMLNKITVKSIEELKKEGKEFQISDDACLTTNTNKPNFLSSLLPFLAWVTPDLYNNNPDIKRSIINVLKRDIYIATSLLIFQLPLVYKRIHKGYSVPSRLKDPAGLFDEVNKLQVAKKKDSVDNTTYVVESLENLQTIFSITGNIVKPLNEIAGYNTSYTDNLISQSYLKILTDDIVKPNITELLNIVENGEKILSKLKVKYTTSVLEQITSELVNHPEDANELFNNYFNWMASKIYKYCKSNNKFNGTEFDWIDKFNIKEEELYNFGYK